VNYSQPETYRDFVSAFSPHAEIFNLGFLSDVDEVGDLATCHRELGKLEHPTAEQKALLNAYNHVALSA